MADGHTLYGTTTRPARLDELRTAGIFPLLFSLDDFADDSSELASCQWIIIAVPPSQCRDYAAGVLHVRRVFPQSRQILISSTGIYPEHPADMDETYPLDPAHRPDFQGAETAMHPEDLILRCAGLFGPERIAGKSFAGRAAPEPDRPVNHVHLEDVIGAVRLLMQHNASGIFNLCAPLHPTRREVYTANAARYGFALPLMPPFSSVEKSKRILGDTISKRFGFSYLRNNPADF